MDAFSGAMEGSGNSASTFCSLAPPWAFVRVAAKSATGPRPGKSKSVGEEHHEIGGPRPREMDAFRDGTEDPGNAAVVFCSLAPPWAFVRVAGQEYDRTQAGNEQVGR